MPVVVYLRHCKNDHFSVLREIDEHTACLAESSLGSRTYSKMQFLAMWQTRVPRGRGWNIRTCRASSWRYCLMRHPGQMRKLQRIFSASSRAVKVAQGGAQGWHSWGYGCAHKPLHLRALIQAEFMLNNGRAAAWGPLEI